MTTMKQAQAERTAAEREAAAAAAKADAAAARLAAIQEREYAELQERLRKHDEAAHATMLKLDAEAERAEAEGQRKIAEQVAELFSAYVDYRGAQQLRWHLHSELGRSGTPPHTGGSATILTDIERALEQAAKNQALDVIDELTEARRKVEES